MQRLSSVRIKKLNGKQKQYRTDITAPKYYQNILEIEKLNGYL